MEGQSDTKIGHLRSPIGRPHGFTGSQASPSFWRPWLFGTGRHIYSTVWSLQVTVLGEDREGELSTVRAASPPIHRGLGTCCPLGAQAVIWSQNAWVCSSLQLIKGHQAPAFRWHMCRGTLGAERTRGGAGGEGSPRQPRSLPRLTPGCRCHHQQPRERASRCRALGFACHLCPWHLEDAWSEVSSLCSLK